MREGYNRIFWGIFFMSFNIKFGPIKILPAFVGILIVSSGLKILHEETKLELFQRSQSIGLLAASVSLIGGAIGFFTGGSLIDFIPMSIWMVMYNIIELTLFFKIQESSIEYLNSNGFPELANENIGKLRTYTIFSIINITLMIFGLIFNISSLMVIVPIIGIILRISLMVIFGSLTKLFPHIDPVN